MTQDARKAGVAPEPLPQLSPSLAAPERAPKRVLGTLTCLGCGKPTPLHSWSQKFCPSCSGIKDAERQRQWRSRKNPRPREQVRAQAEKQRSATLARGAAISLSHKGGLGMIGIPPTMEWSVGIVVPFTWRASKNFIYGVGRGGHVHLREQVREFRREVELRLRVAMRGQAVVQNKVWVDIYVQKSHHKGDAINVVDTVCDAIKYAIDIDDRWFCIRRLDWEIVKDGGQLYIGIGQEVGAADVQACSSCGRLLPFSEFGKKTRNKRGIDRNCRDCRGSGPLPEPA